MRRTSDQNPPETANKSISFGSLRYSTFFVWVNGYLDSRRGIPTARELDGKTFEEESLYEKLLREYFQQRAIMTDEWAVSDHHQLEVIRQSAQQKKTAGDELLPVRQQEHDEAAQELRSSFEKYGFSAWSVASVTLLAGLFMFELPINYLAFSSQGDAPILTLSAVLAVSVIIPTAAHAGGERLAHKQTSAKLTGAAVLAMLLGLITCIAIFRMRSFLEMALANAEISRLSPTVVTIFYLLLQALFVFIAAQKSHANTKPVEKVEALKLKYDKVRYKHALVDLEGVLAQRVRAEENLLQVSVAQSRLAAERNLKLNTIESKYRELVGVYRRRSSRRKGTVAAAPASWSQPGGAPPELRYRARVNQAEGPAARNGNKPHAPAYNPAIAEHLSARPNGGEL